MDLSKLPRLSKTPPAPGPAEPTAGALPPAGPVPPAGDARRGAFCDQCGAALRAGARFCDNCGAAIADVAGVPIAARPVAARAPMEYGVGDSPGGVAVDVWFSVVIGLLFLFLGGSFAKYHLTRLGGGTYHTGYFWAAGSAKEGKEVTVAELEPAKRLAFDQQLMTDGALFLFGCALMLDGLVRVLAITRLPGRRWFVAFGLAVTVWAVAYNLYAAARLMKADVIPLLSLLCIAFGGYVVFAQWMTLRALATSVRPRGAVA